MLHTIQSFIICKSRQCKNKECKYAHPREICKIKQCNKACGKSHSPHNALKIYFCRFGTNCNYKNNGCPSQHNCPYVKYSYCSNANCIYDHPQLPQQQLQHLNHDFNELNVGYDMDNNIRYYTTKDISCPGCKWTTIACKEYHPDPNQNKCDYGHARKNDNEKGPRLFCDYGKKVSDGGGCTHSKCNRRHVFHHTNLHQVKCPRECANSQCFLKKCPYFHNGQIGANGQNKWNRGQLAYGNSKTSKSKTTKDLACVLNGCNGNLCNNAYSHPNRHDIGENDNVSVTKHAGHKRQRPGCQQNMSVPLQKKRKLSVTTQLSQSLNTFHFDDSCDYTTFFTSNKKQNSKNKKKNINQRSITSFYKSTSTKNISEIASNVSIKIKQTPKPKIKQTYLSIAVKPFPTAESINIKIEEKQNKILISPPPSMTATVQNPPNQIDDKPANNKNQNMNKNQKQSPNYNYKNQSTQRRGGPIQNNQYPNNQTRPNNQFVANHRNNSNNNRGFRGNNKWQHYNQNNRANVQNQNQRQQQNYNQSQVQRGPNYANNSYNNPNQQRGPDNYNNNANRRNINNQYNNRANYNQNNRNNINYNNNINYIQNRYNNRNNQHNRGDSNYNAYNRGKRNRGQLADGNLNSKTSKSKTTEDLACVLNGCNGNLCNNAYSHPKRHNIGDKQKYYCQFDKACRFYPACFDNHSYEWTCDASPQYYVCQFWGKQSGCNSDANKCRMFHPNGKKSKHEMHAHEMKSEEKKEEEVEEDDSKLCIVCLDGVRDHVFIPCGHIAVCKDCKDSYNGDDAQCPLCREKVDMVIKIFN